MFLVGDYAGELTQNEKATGMSQIKLDFDSNARIVNYPYHFELYFNNVGTL